MAEPLGENFIHEQYITQIIEPGILPVVRHQVAILSIPKMSAGGSWLQSKTKIPLKISAAVDHVNVYLIYLKHKPWTNSTGFQTKQSSLVCFDGYSAMLTSSCVGPIIKFTTQL